MASSRFRSFLAALALLAGVDAHAAIIEQYTYVDPYGIAKTADSTTAYINPNGAVTFAAIAGIERKLEVSFRAQDGTVLSTVTSPVITAADRITLDGRPYYGFFLDLQAPAGDGTYNIRARVLTRENVQVSLEQYPVIIDRTPPSLSGGFGWDAWRPTNLMPMPDNVLVSRYESKRLWAEGIIETGSGLDTTTARFQSLYLEGANAGRVALETPAVVDAINKQVSIGNGVSNDIKPGVHFPNQNGRYLARFVVFDRAGNVASFDKPLHWHAVCPLMSDLQPFAVYDPDSSANPLLGSPFAGYVPYVAGMEVKTNPVRMVYRIPRTRWWEDATFGMSIGKRMPANTDWPLDPADWTNAQYAFERIDYPYVPGGTSLGADYRLAAPTLYSCGFLVAPDLRLSPAAPKSPKLLAHRTVWKNAGATNDHVRYSNVSDTILSAGPIAEARPYAQTYQMGDLGSCTIPPGETTCMVANNFVLGDTPDLMEMYHRWNRLLSPDGALSSEMIAPVQAFDLRKPVVQGATLSADGHSASLVMSEYQTGIWWGTVKLASAYLVAEDDSGTVRRIDATGLESTDGVLTWKATVSLATLPSGIYTLRFYAVDAYGNTSEPRTIAGHRRDATAPTASIFTMPGRAQLHGGRLSSLSQVRFTVSDDIDLSPVVTRVRLTGGPLNDDINLGYHKSGGEYSVEFPQMLPSLGNGDYVLAVTAKDSKNNSATTSATFDYGPPRFGLTPEVGTTIAIPIIDVPTRRSDDLWPLTSVPAKMAEAGGMPITGNSDLIMMLSADAQGPLIVGGIRIAPGASAVYSSYDFTASQSVLTLPVYPADPGSTRPGRFGTLVVQIDRPDAPAFIEDVEAWVPGENIDVVQRLPSFARHVETASISLVNRGDRHCPRLITLKEGQEYRNHLASNNIGICAAMWVSLPPKLEPHHSDPARLAGVIASDEESVTLRYQPGILIKGAAPPGEDLITIQPSPEIPDSSLFTFYPSGEPVEHTVPLHDPDPPTITLGAVSERAAQTRWLPDGKFPTAIGSVVSGYANGRSALPEYRGLHMTITDTASGAVIFEQGFTSNFGRGAIRTDIPTIEGEQTFRVDLHYLNHPSIATSATMTFVALPRSPMIKLIRPTDPSNITETVLEGRFGLASRTDISYDQSVIGRWEIRIYKRDGGTARTQLGSATTAIAPDGTFSVNLGTLPAGSYPILAQATYLGTSPDINATVESQPSVIKVYDGNPVTFKLVASRDAGRAPLTTTVKIWMTDPKRGSDVESIRWERSSDGVTFQDIPLEDRYKRSFGYGERLLEPGEYWYRATTLNRFSGATHTADPIKVHIYDVPAFTLSGFKSTFTGTPVEWSADPESGQRPAVYRWSVRRGRYNDPEPLLLDGPTQRLNADVNGSWYVTVEGRFADAPDVPSAWRKVSGLLKVTPPYMSRPRIVGPYSVETGKSYTYSASAYIPIRGADPDLVIAGRWQLPDGSTRDGDVLDYTIRPGDAEITYTAWVNGYRAETEQTTSIRLRPWDYQFPQFRMYKRQIREYDPAQYSYSIVQVGGATGTGTGMEAPSYQWDFPPGALVDQRSNTTAIVSASTPGTYPVSVRAYDTRGNDAELADSFDVSEPPPLTASLKLLVGDAWNRAPAKLTARWYVDGLLSRESVNGMSVRLNGTPVSERVLSSYTFDIAEIGEQVVDIDLRTTYGRTASYSADVELIEGDLPSCSIKVTTGSSLRAQAVCSVPMGRLVGYRWDVTYADTGETRDLGLRSSAILFGATEIARGISRIRMIAINDKGQEAPPATWTP